MQNLSSNASLSPSEHTPCVSGLSYKAGLSLIDIITVLVGQPVLTKLLLITFTSKKSIDILNCNLAIFHNLQYLITTMHLVVLFLSPSIQAKVLKFLFVYAQIGGPMSLSFICMERYVAVIYPTSYHLLKKYRVREICAGAVWCFSLPTAFVTVLSAENLSSFREDVLENLPFFWSLTMTVMMVQCSHSILKMLKKSGPCSNKMHPAKKKAFKTVCATSVMVLIFYIPVTILDKSKFVDECIDNHVIRPVSILLLSAASVVHPLLYLSSQKKLSPCIK